MSVCVHTCACKCVHASAGVCLHSTHVEVRGQPRCSGALYLLFEIVSFFGLEVHHRGQASGSHTCRGLGLYPPHCHWNCRRILLYWIFHGLCGLNSGLQACKESPYWMSSLPSLKHWFLFFLFCFLMVIVWVLLRVNAISFHVCLQSRKVSCGIHFLDVETTQLSTINTLLVNRPSSPVNSSKSNLRINIWLLPYKTNFGNCTEKYVVLGIMYEIYSFQTYANPVSLYYFSFF